MTNLSISKTMKICLYPGGIEYFKMGGIKTAYENKKQALSLHNVDYSSHPLHKKFDILQLECPSPNSAFYALCARKKNKKIVMGTHVTVEDYKETFTFSKTTSSFLKRYLKWYYSLADLLIAPSEYTKQLVINYGVKKPIKVISNGLHPSFPIHPLRKSLGKNKKPVIGTAGYVTKRKGVLTFCHLAKQYPEYDFKWVGAMNKGLLFDVSSMRKLDNVEFLGYVKDIKKAYASFDVFLFPSYEENQGIVLLEAASFGLPLIVRDLPVYSGWLVHGENCLKCKDDSEFANNLKSVLIDKSLKQKLCKNSQILAEVNDLKHIGKQLISSYDSLLSN